MSLESRRNLAAELRDRVQFLSNPDVSWALSSSVDDLPVTRPVGRSRVFAEAGSTQEVAHLHLLQSSKFLSSVRCHRPW